MRSRKDSVSHVKVTWAAHLASSLEAEWSRLQRLSRVHQQHPRPRQTDSVAPPPPERLARPSSRKCGSRSADGRALWRQMRGRLKLRAHVPAMDIQLHQPQIHKPAYGDERPRMVAEFVPVCGVRGAPGIGRSLHRRHGRRVTTAPLTAASSPASIGGPRPSPRVHAGHPPPGSPSGGEAGPWSPRRIMLV